MKKNLLFISILTGTLLSNSAFAQKLTEMPEDKTKKIEVVGSAEMQIVPDEIFVNITLQEYYNKQKSKVDIDKIQRDFLDKCKQAEISKERIQIENMNGFDQSNWYWRKRKKEQPDLMASTTYILKFTNASDIDKLVNLLDDNSTQNLFISKTGHSKMEDFRKEVKIKALQAAKTKAQYLCESIGEKAGNALYIKEVAEDSNMPMFRSRAMSNKALMDESGGANEGIDFQKITVRCEVKAQFAIQ